MVGDPVEAPATPVAGAAPEAVAGAGVGLMLWVIAARGLLRDRAVLERWVSEVVTALRGTLEERVAARVLAAESVFGSALAERDVTAAAPPSGRGGRPRPRDR